MVHAIDDRGPCNPDSRSASILESKPWQITPVGQRQRRLKLTDKGIILSTISIIHGAGVSSAASVHALGHQATVKPRELESDK